MIPISEKETPNSSFALFNLAFRPFFLAGSIFLCVALFFWLGVQGDVFNWGNSYNPVWWHAHELIFGFGTAIIVGFLLTAVQTWTGIKGLHGIPLFLLFSLWLSARLLMLLPYSLNPVLIAFLDVCFLISSALVLTYPIVKIKQRRNVVFPILLLIFAAINGLSHYAEIKHDQILAMHSLHAAIMLITLIVTVMGGRVIPFFTANASAYQRKENLFSVELVSITSMIAILMCALNGFEHVNPVLLSSIAVVACVSHTIRLSRWGPQHTLKVPLLWSLHLAYSFIPLGMALLALWSVGVISNLSAVLHSFTVGSMMSMILAMISRVALGHTGRMLQAPRAMPFAFACLGIAALCRTIGILLFPGFYHSLIMVSGSLCILSFSLFLYYYAPFLSQARVDGRQG